MNRRNFLEFLGLATVGVAVAYSFPKVIVPKNVTSYKKMLFRISDNSNYGFGFSGFTIPINITNQKEIYPKTIDEGFFTDIDYQLMERTYKKACEGFAEPSCIYVKEGFIYNNV